MPNLADILSHSAAAHPDRTAIKLDDRELSYRELDAVAAKVAGLLRAKGVGHGDRIGVMLPNVSQFAACYYGALRLGAAVVPLNVLLKEREVAFYLGDSEARVPLAWLGEESRYRRFFTSTQDLSTAELDYLVDVDHSDHEAIIAIDPLSGAAVGATSARTTTRSSPRWR